MMAKSIRRSKRIGDGTSTGTAASRDLLTARMEISTATLSVAASSCTVASTVVRTRGSSASCSCSGTGSIVGIVGVFIMTMIIFMGYSCPTMMMTMTVTTMFPIVVSSWTINPSTTTRPTHHPRLEQQWGRRENNNNNGQDVLLGGRRLRQLLVEGGRFSSSTGSSSIYAGSSFSSSFGMPHTTTKRRMMEGQRSGQTWLYMSSSSSTSTTETATEMNDDNHDDTNNKNNNEKNYVPDIEQGSVTTSSLESNSNSVMNYIPDVEQGSVTMSPLESISNTVMNYKPDVEQGSVTKSSLESNSNSVMNYIPDVEQGNVTMSSLESNSNTVMNYKPDVEQGSVTKSSLESSSNSVMMMNKDDAIPENLAFFVTPVVRYDEGKKMKTIMTTTKPKSVSRIPQLNMEMFQEKKIQEFISMTKLVVSETTTAVIEIVDNVLTAIVNETKRINTNYNLSRSNTTSNKNNNTTAFISLKLRSNNTSIDIMNDNDDDDKNQIQQQQQQQSLLVTNAYGAAISTAIVSMIVFGIPDDSNSAVALLVVPATIASYISATESLVGYTISTIGSITWDITTSIMKYLIDEIQIQQVATSFINTTIVTLTKSLEQKVTTTNLTSTLTANDTTAATAAATATDSSITPESSVDSGSIHLYDGIPSEELELPTSIGTSTGSSSVAVDEIVATPVMDEVQPLQVVVVDDDEIEEQIETVMMDINNNFQETGVETATPITTTTTTTTLAPIATTIASAATMEIVSTAAQETIHDSLLEVEEEETVLKVAPAVPETIDDRIIEIDDDDEDPLLLGTTSSVDYEEYDVDNDEIIIESQQQQQQSFQDENVVLGTTEKTIVEIDGISSSIDEGAFEGYTQITDTIILNDDNEGEYVGKTLLSIDAEQVQEEVVTEKMSAVEMSSLAEVAVSVASVEVEIEKEIPRVMDETVAHIVDDSPVEGHAQGDKISDDDEDGISKVVVDGVKDEIQGTISPIEARYSMFLENAQNEVETEEVPAVALQSETKEATISEVSPEEIEEVVDDAVYVVDEKAVSNEVVILEISAEGVIPLEQDQLSYVDDGTVEGYIQAATISTINDDQAEGESTVVVKDDNNVTYSMGFENAHVDVVEEEVPATGPAYVTELAVSYIGVQGGFEVVVDEELVAVEGDTVNPDTGAGTVNDQIDPFEANIVKTSMNENEGLDVDGVIDCTPTRVDTVGDEPVDLSDDIASVLPIVSDEMEQVSVEEVVTLEEVVDESKKQTFVASNDVYDRVVPVAAEDANLHSIEELPSGETSSEVVFDIHLEERQLEDDNIVITDTTTTVAKDEIEPLLQPIESAENVTNEGNKKTKKSKTRGKSKNQ